MGHQINFFLGPTDLSELETRLRSLGELTILYSRSLKPEPRIVDSVDFTEDGKQWMLYLARPAALSEIVLKQVVTQGYWTVNSLFSAVIELDRCHYDRKVLKRGRLYYVDGFYVQDQWVEKTFEFKVWAKRIFAAARKTLKYDKELLAYIGPEALEMRSRRIEFREF